MVALPRWMRDRYDTLKQQDTDFPPIHSTKPNRLLRIAYASFFGFLVLAIIGIHAIRSSLPPLPAVTFKWNESPYDPRKVALLIENRPQAHITPLLLHFTSVIPPDWRVRFMGSTESVAMINASRAVQHQVNIGKMDLTYIPSNMSTAGQEQISQFLTTLWVYETLLQPAEWLLIFQTDSMLCANTNRTLNEWLEYDWVGAPWSPSARYGGNGGLSLRKVSAIIDVLKNQIRIPSSDPEDVWLSNRLGQRVGAKVANGTLELQFSGENCESTRPLGYHTGTSGLSLGGGNWGTVAKRKELYEYCPELKMMLEMDVEEYIPGHCNQEWKREEYPVPPYLVPF